MPDMDSIADTWQLASHAHSTTAHVKQTGRGGHLRAAALVAGWLRVHAWLAPPASAWVSATLDVPHMCSDRLVV